MGELASYYRSSVAAERFDEVVYETYSLALSLPEGSNEMLHATTILFPGSVDDQPFMTRGHFHVNPSHGEFMMTLRGRGVLALMNREGECWQEPSQPGTIHQIDGRHAHRAVNPFDEPWIFLVTWNADCGHDYASITPESFSANHK